MHPSHEVPKVYKVTLDKNVSAEHVEQIAAGLTLDDGPVQVDWVNYTQPEEKKVVSLEIHIGRNRIVRRIFEHLGYEVVQLDRPYLAGLTKKDLPRSFFRYLTSQEITLLKHFVR
jgi:23S rRNA pseudouridine2605 synthase